MKDTLRETAIGFMLGVLVGAFTTIWGMGQNNKLVTVRGVKDSFQTVEWQDKTYRLVPLDKGNKP